MWPPPPGVSIRKALKFVVACGIAAVTVVALMFALRPPAITTVLGLFAGAMTLVYLYGFCVLRIQDPDDPKA